MSAKIPKVDAPNETTSLTSRRVEGAAAATDAMAVEEEETTQIPPEIDSELLFDLQMVLDGFTQCKKDDGQLYLDGYLRAYSEINKYGTLSLVCVVVCDTVLSLILLLCV